MEKVMNMKYRLVLPVIFLSFSVSAVNSDATNDCVAGKVQNYTAQTGIKGPDIAIPIVEDMYKQCGGTYGDDEWDYDLDENLDKIQKCEEEHLNAFKLQNGEDAVVSRDILDEWTVQCGGKVE